MPSKFFVKPASESREPLELVFVFFRVDGLTVGYIRADNTERALAIPHGRGDDALLFVGKCRHCRCNLGERSPRQDGDAVVGLLPGPRAAVPGSFDFLERELGVLELDLL